MKAIVKVLAAVAMLATSMPAGAQLLTEENSKIINHQDMEAEFVVCGGGLSGLCAAVSAARHGATVVRVGSAIFGPREERIKE